MILRPHLWPFLFPQRSWQTCELGYCGVTLVRVVIIRKARVLITISVECEGKHRNLDFELTVTYFDRVLMRRRPK